MQSAAGIHPLFEAECFLQNPGSESVNLEILSIIGWVAVWETTNILIIERQVLQRSKKNMDKIIRSKFIFHQAENL